MKTNAELREDLARYLLKASNASHTTEVERWELVADMIDHMIDCAIQRLQVGKSGDAK